MSSKFIVMLNLNLKLDKSTWMMCLCTFSWSEAPLGIFPAGDMPAIRREVAALLGTEESPLAGVVDVIEFGTIGAITGATTARGTGGGGATGTGATNNSIIN